VALGGVKAAIGAPDQRLRSVNLVQGGNADRTRHATEMLDCRTLYQFLVITARRI